jgi:hypothetical protein
MVGWVSVQILMAEMVAAVVTREVRWTLVMGAR